MVGTIAAVWFNGIGEAPGARGTILERKSHRIQLEHVTRDGIEYEITVLTADGGLYAGWSCKGCGVSGINALLTPTQSEAICSAQSSIDAHHYSLHRLSAEPLQLPLED